MADSRPPWHTAAVTRLSCLALLLVACSTPPPPAATPPPSSTPPPSAPEAPAATPTPATAAPAPKPPPAPSHPTEKRGTWTKSHDAPVRSLGIGKRRVAVLGASAWMRDGGKWKEIAFPDKLKPAAGAKNEARIFFGRDDRPRLMGMYRGDPLQAVYYRYKGGWRKEPKEIGHLANEPKVPLFGILGHDDPEVVCKLGKQCIIKRLTGWTMVPPGDEELWVELAGPEAWGVGQHKLVFITNDGWKAHGGKAPYATPGGVWGSKKGGVWVSEPATNQVHRFSGQAWTSEPSPVEEPWGLFGFADDDVWLVGKGGAAHFDGKGWSRVDGPKGPLREVRGAPDGTLWMAGESGTWSGAL